MSGFRKWSRERRHYHRTANTQRKRYRDSRIHRKLIQRKRILRNRLCRKWFRTSFRSIWCIRTSSVSVASFSAGYRINCASIEDFIILFIYLSRIPGDTLSKSPIKQSTFTSSLHAVSSPESAHTTVSNLCDLRYILTKSMSVFPPLRSNVLPNVLLSVIFTYFFLFGLWNFSCLYLMALSQLFFHIIHLFLTFQRFTLNIIYVFYKPFICLQKYTAI